VSSIQGQDLLRDALPGVADEQRLEVVARSVRVMDVEEGGLAVSELRRLAAWAEIVLFELRDGHTLVEVLRAERDRSASKTFVPLAGGSGDVLSLCRMGSFTMERAAREARPMMLGRAPQITRVVEGVGSLLPVGALRHARNSLRVARYWAAGGPRNNWNLLRLVLREYAGGRGPIAEPPEELPPLRLEDPASGAASTSLRAWLRAHPPQGELPWVGLLYYGSRLRGASAVAAAALSESFAGRANLLPVACDGVRSLHGLRRMLRDSHSPRLHALVSLLWFRLGNGRSAVGEEDSLSLLDELQVPLFVPATLYTRRRSHWEDALEGLSAQETFATVAIPEQDGARAPLPVLALPDADPPGPDGSGAVALQEGVQRLADRVLAWIHLRERPRSERRLALLLSDFPPGPAHLGCASQLDVAASLTAILQMLGAGGYDVGPLCEDPLAVLFSEGLHNGTQGGDWRGERLSLESYRALLDSLPAWRRAELERSFGPAPGKILTDERGLRIPGRWFGKVFVGLQPARVPPGSPAAATYERLLPPHHQYLAFFGYLRQSGVQAVVHLGDHGSLEYLPGKALALSQACYPELLHGDLPQLCLHGLSRPDRSSLARRRWQALVLDHHGPDLVAAGLHGPYEQLWLQLQALDSPQGSPQASRSSEGEILRCAADLGLASDSVDELRDQLEQLRCAAVPAGLHVFGQVKDDRSLVRYLQQLAHYRVSGVRLRELAVELTGVEGADACVERWLATFVASGSLPADLQARLKRNGGRGLQDRLAEISARYRADGELPSLARALDGGWVAPGPLGDPLRSPEVFPTGRFGFAADPTAAPTAQALERGADLAQAMLVEHRRATGMHLGCAALMLVASETARSGGETIGMLLHLLGARVSQRATWLPAFEPVPMAELERPRVDVQLLCCGYFRDMYPNLVRDLDGLMRQLASLDEPEALNPQRVHAEASSGELGLELAGTRIFGPARGQYGSDLPEMVQAARWGAPASLGEQFARAMGYGYGAHQYGAVAHRALERGLARTQLVAQLVGGHASGLDELDGCYAFLGGTAQAVQRARGAMPRVVVVDGSREGVRLHSARWATRLYSCTRLLNPRWIEAMLQHRWHGSQQVMARFTRLVGMAATLGVEPDLFDKLCATYLQDEELFSRLVANNPWACAALVGRLSEAARRGFWQPDSQQAALIQRRMLEAEEAR